jgi:AraC-like DNA-binding protein
MDVLRIRTNDLPSERRLEMFREIFGKQILRIEIEPQPETTLDVDMTLQALPGLGIASGTLSPMCNRLTKPLIDNDDIVLVLFKHGVGTARQYGRSELIGHGQAILTANDAPATFDAHVPSHVVNLRFGRQRLFRRTARAEENIARPIASDNPALRLLSSYLDVIRGFDSHSPPLLQDLAVDHLHDLAALALGATRDSAENAKRSVRAARFAAIKAYATANATRPDLSIGMLAAFHNVSPRYVRSLFQSDETTFSDFILNARLAHVHARLGDPRFANHTISSLAFSAGFGDLSHFNHRFRRKYGATPSDVRAMAHRDHERQ